MIVRIHCITCGNKFITRCDCEVGDVISSALDPKLADHKGHEVRCYYD